MSEQQEDWYQILNVSPNATTEEIKIAHRTQSLQWHPDRITRVNAFKHSENDDENRMYYTTKSQQINNAKDILLDTNQRAAFDAFRKVLLHYNY